MLRPPVPPGSDIQGANRAVQTTETISKFFKGITTVCFPYKVVEAVFVLLWLYGG